MLLLNNSACLISDGSSLHGHQMLLLSVDTAVFSLFCFLKLLMTFFMAGLWDTGDSLPQAKGIMEHRIAAQTSILF